MISRSSSFHGPKGLENSRPDNMYGPKENPFLSGQSQKVIFSKICQKFKKTQLGTTLTHLLVLICVKKSEGHSSMKNNILTQFFEHLRTTWHRLHQLKLYLFLEICQKKIFQLVSRCVNCHILTSIIRSNCAKKIFFTSMTQLKLFLFESKFKKKQKIQLELCQKIWKKIWHSSCQNWRCAEKVF